jgi:hypothetical protein
MAILADGEARLSAAAPQDLPRRSSTTARQPAQMLVATMSANATQRLHRPRRRRGRRSAA